MRRLDRRGGGVALLCLGLWCVPGGADGVTGRRSGEQAPTLGSTFAADSLPPAPVVQTPPKGAVLGTRTPVFSGSAQAGSFVALTLDGTVLPAVQANNIGAWSFTPSQPLQQGAHTVTARATNGAGSGPSSEPLSFTVDTIAPAAPVIVTPADGAWLEATLIETVILSGTAEGGGTVIVFVDAKAAGTTPVSASGNWSLAPVVAPGTHVVTARTTDAAGNLSPLSREVRVTLQQQSHYDVGCSSASGGLVGAWALFALAPWRRRHAARRAR